MNIIIPLAGHSRRFQKAGFTEAKPFINIDGKPMIERVCRMFATEDAFYFVCQNEHLSNDRYYRLLKKIVPHATIIGINPHESGPVSTALHAEEFIKNKKKKSDND